MPGRPKEGRKSQVYKRMMAKRAKGIVVEDKVKDKVEPKVEKKEESKVDKVKKLFKEDETK